MGEGGEEREGARMREREDDGDDDDYVHVTGQRQYAEFQNHCQRKRLRQRSLHRQN